MKRIVVAVVVCVFAATTSASTITASTQHFLQEVLPKDFQVSDYIEFTKNGYQSNELEGRSNSDLESNVEDYIKSHDVTFKLPIVGSTVTLAARNLDNDEVDVKLRFNNGEKSVEEVRGKKHKLKKILVPIFVFILIKAMVLIPLALGILAIKTWNALQLSFVSFVVAIGLAVWNLCKKVSGDHEHPHIIAHSEWDPHGQYAARNLDAQDMVYSAYKQ